MLCACIFSRLSLIFLCAGTASSFFAPAAPAVAGVGGARRFGGRGRRRTSVSGYKFGDLSRSLGKKISTVTGKDYEFGDLSRWADAQAKSAAANLTDSDEYRFGDLTRWVDARAKSAAANFTHSEEYQFGDLTKEIGRRVASGEYTFGDLITLLKVLLSFGVGLSPVSAILPVQLLVNILNYSIANDVGERLIGALAVEVDKKMKEAVTGDPNYRVGDLTGRAVNSFTGKDGYEFGDITRTVMTMVEDGKKDGANGKALFEDEKVMKELEVWETKREDKEKE